MPELKAALTTARMTAFSPGASPPPVKTPILDTEDIARNIPFGVYGRARVRGARTQVLLGEAGHPTARRVVAPPKAGVSRRSVLRLAQFRHCCAILPLLPRPEVFPALEID